MKTSGSAPFSGALLAALLLQPLYSHAQNKVNWSVTPYLWATKTSYDLNADGSPVDTGTINFDDLMDSTDASFQIAVEVGRDQGHWSLMTDVTYIETSDDETVTLPSVGVLRIDSESKQVHADLAVAWWPCSEAGGLSVLAGIRYTDLDDESKFKLVEPDLGQLGNLRTDRDFTDALVGARYVFSLGGRWKLNTQLDYGFGDSEGILQAHAIVRYAMGKDQQNGLMLGYRYKDSEFDDGGLEEDYDYKGPVIGFNFRF